MKNATLKLTIAAAMLAVATGVASAQNLKADIPFAFRAGDHMMSAGAYTIEFAGNRHDVLVLKNYEAKQVAVILASAPWALVVLVGVLIVVDRGVIAREERCLESTFGESYRRYKRRTRRWL